MQHFRKILILVSFWSCVSSASEVDQYTYAHIPLADSKNIINKIVNDYIQNTLQGANTSLTKLIPANGEENTLKSAELTFFLIWENLKLTDQAQNFNPYFLAISTLEHCIKTNDCEGWPNIERILHTHADSIYGRSDYDLIPSYILAPVVNVCGVRIGGDKLSHFLEDGRIYYHNYMVGMSVERIQALMEEAEQEYFGLESTGVYSHSDIYVNYKGLEFFKKMFESENPYIVYNSGSQKLEQNRSFNICDYVDENWDERVLKNSYGDRDTAKLFEIIEQEEKNPTQIDRETLLNREVEPLSFITNFELGIKAKWEGTAKFNSSLIYFGKSRKRVQVIFKRDRSGF